jgi:hypothetical protein
MRGQQPDQQPQVDRQHDQGSGDHPGQCDPAGHRREGDRDEQADLEHREDEVLIGTAVAC